MKAIFTFLLVVVNVLIANAQTTESWLWPIADAKPGQNMISVPQGTINGEFNFAKLFIGAPEGAAVIAPADATITDISVFYLSNLNYSIGYHMDGSINNTIKLVANDDKAKSQMQTKFLNGHLSLSLGDGRTMYISGIKSDRIYKTGEKLRRGDTIGKVWYCYNKINEPSISVSVSKFGKPDDPMSSFGIRTTFIPFGPPKIVEKLTKEQAKQDFTIYTEALKECFVGLYDVISEEDFETFVKQNIAKIDSYPGDVPYLDFRLMMRMASGRIHDSHLGLQYPQWEQEQNKDGLKPSTYVGWIGDTLSVTIATQEHQNLIGKQIAKINGISADSAKRYLTSMIDSYDASAGKAYIDARLVFNGFNGLYSATPRPVKYDMDLEFTDGTKVTTRGVKPTREYFIKINDEIKGLGNNYHRGGYVCRIEDDSTAYVGLTTFGLDDVSVEKIGVFLDSIQRAGVGNLIFDVRNNPGGHDYVISKLFSYISAGPLTLSGYSQVNKQGGYKSFAHSLNRVVEDSLFSGYKAIDGRKGFYDISDEPKVVLPDSAINYKGRLYVLVNENSVSAATLFPALVVRSRRGVIVGRESSTAYHFMNALKFVEISLPNSTITVRMPLVKCVFDTVVNARVPYGRGVLPDYEVPLTMEEFSKKNGDPFITRAKELIRNGDYLSAENPFDVHSTQEQDANPYLGVIIPVVTCGLVVAIVIVRRTRKR